MYFLLLYSHIVYAFFSHPPLFSLSLFSPFRVSEVDNASSGVRDQHNERQPKTPRAPLLYTHAHFGRIFCYSQAIEKHFFFFCFLSFIDLIKIISFASKSFFFKSSILHSLQLALFTTCLP